MDSKASMDRLKRIAGRVQAEPELFPVALLGNNGVPNWIQQTSRHIYQEIYQISRFSLIGGQIGPFLSRLLKIF